jgi:hypothetical protein
LHSFVVVNTDGAPARLWLHNILAVLITAADMTKVVVPSRWRIHQLNGN